MFVKIKGGRNETINKILDCFNHEFDGTEYELRATIKEKSMRVLAPHWTNDTKDILFEFVRDYIQADYKGWEEFYDNAIVELTQDVFECFKKIGMTYEETEKFHKELDNDVNMLTKHIMDYLEKKYPTLQIKTGDIDFNETRILDCCIDRIVNICENVAIKNMTEKEKK